MDSSQRASRRPAGFDVPQETFENRIEVARRFPERRVPQAGQAMTVPFPQIAIGDGIEVIEIDEAIRATVHHRERDWTVFHDQALVNAFSGACGLEKPLAETAVRAYHGVTKKRLGRIAEDRLDESFDVSPGQVLLPATPMCGEALKPCAMLLRPTGGVPVTIRPRIPEKRGTISMPIWPPSDQPNTIASVTPSFSSNSTAASAKPGRV